MSLNTIRDIFEGDIQEAAQRLSETLPLTAPQLRNAYDDDTIRELQSLIDEVNAATDDNVRIAKLQQRAGSVLKLLRGFGIGL